MNYKHEARKLRAFYLVTIGIALILWAVLSASPAIELYEDGSGIVTMQGARVDSFCLPFAICND